MTWENFLADEIQFSRRPYTVSYVDNAGVKKTIRRQPPPRLHDMWPEDLVELNTRKNQDFDAGDEFEVKHINYRHPNTIQIVNDDDETTFVSYTDLNLEEARGKRHGVTPLDQPINNRYLVWP